MPGRDQFPIKYFDGNPMEGETPVGAYRRLQWGNEPDSVRKIEAPEEMMALGRLAMIHFADGTKEKSRDWQYFLAVGKRSNFVYFVPMDGSRRPISFPVNFFAGIRDAHNSRLRANALWWKKSQRQAMVVRTDYYSEKGGAPGYYFHDHEEPYPQLAINHRHRVLIPAEYQGRRSYAVGDEGIIG
jgi:hypothetical protein